MYGLRNGDWQRELLQCGKGRGNLQLARGPNAQMCLSEEAGV